MATPGQKEQMVILEQKEKMATLEQKEKMATPEQKEQREILEQKEKMAILAPREILELKVISESLVRVEEKKVYKVLLELLVVLELGAIPEIRATKALWEKKGTWG